MFCGNCGANQPDGANFCSVCGGILQVHNTSQKIQLITKVKSPAPITQGKPVYQSAAMQSTMPDIPPHFSKLEKHSGKLVLITFFLSLVLLVVSVSVPITRNIYEIPCIETLTKAVGINHGLEIAQNKLKGLVVETKEEYERINDVMSSEHKEAIEELLNAADTLFTEFSLLNFRNMVEVTSKVSGEVEIYKGFKLDLFATLLSQIEIALDFIILGTAALFLLPLIFTMLGGLLKSKVMTIIAAVCMVLTQLFLCGFPFIVLSLLIYIPQAILCEKAQKFKKHQKQQHAKISFS